MFNNLPHRLQNFGLFEPYKDLIKKREYDYTDKNYNELFNRIEKVYGGQNPKAVETFVKLLKYSADQRPNIGNVIEYLENIGKKIFDVPTSIKPSKLSSIKRIKERPIDDSIVYI